ncbi:MAG: hypothetical protein ACOYM5_08830 [Caulobacter sp.]
MQADPEERDAERRALEAAHSLYFVPAYRGHWIGAVLLGATMTGAAMLYTLLPTALAVLGGGALSGRVATTFLLLYAAMVVGPIGGWVLWGLRRRWAALAATALFALCVAWLGPAVGT